MVEKVATTVQRLLGIMEVQLLEMDGDLENTERAGWADAHCPLLARAFYVHKGKFAAEATGIDSVAGIGEAIRNHQWIWDKRNTKAGIEARSLHEALQAVTSNKVTA